MLAQAARRCFTAYFSESYLFACLRGNVRSMRRAVCSLRNALPKVLPIFIHFYGALKHPKHATLTANSVTADSEVVWHVAY